MLAPARGKTHELDGTREAIPVGRFIAIEREQVGDARALAVSRGERDGIAEKHEAENGDLDDFTFRIGDAEREIALGHDTQ